MKAVYPVIIIILSLPAWHVRAQADPTESTRVLEVNYPGGKLNELGEAGKLGPLQWVETIYDFAFVIVGAVAFISLVYAGIRWMTSRQDEGIRDARDRMQGVVYGLLLLGVSVLLLNLINPDLTKLREPLVKPPKSTLPESPGGGSTNDPRPGPEAGYGTACTLAGGGTGPECLQYQNLECKHTGYIGGGQSGLRSGTCALPDQLELGESCLLNVIDVCAPPLRCVRAENSNAPASVGTCTAQ